MADQVGSDLTAGKRTFPYGEPFAGTAASDETAFATDHRDSTTGLDYAEQRYFASQWGRFLTPDPSAQSMGAARPQGWNRYAYVLNDPTNLLPLGLYAGYMGLPAFCSIAPQACPHGATPSSGSTGILNTPGVTLMANYGCNNLGVCGSGYGCAIGGTNQSGSPGAVDIRFGDEVGGGFSSTTYCGASPAILTAPLPFSWNVVIGPTLTKPIVEVPPTTPLQPDLLQRCSATRS